MFESMCQPLCRVLKFSPDEEKGSWTETKIWDLMVQIDKFRTILAESENIPWNACTLLITTCQLFICRPVHADGRVNCQPSMYCDAQDGVPFTQHHVEHHCPNQVTSRRELDIKQAMFLMMLKETHRVARHAAKEGAVKHIQAQAEEAQAAAKENNTAKLFSIIKQLSSKVVNRMPGVSLKDNSVASSPLAIRQRWQRVFAEKLGGHMMKITDMHLAMVERQEKHFDTRMLEAIPIQYVPTIEQLSAIISRAKPRKAHGEDGIPAEVYAAGALGFHCRDDSSLEGAPLLGVVCFRLCDAVAVFTVLCRWVCAQTAASVMPTFPAHAFGVSFRPFVTVAVVFLLAVS